MFRNERQQVHVRIQCVVQVSPPTHPDRPHPFQNCWWSRKLALCLFALFYRLHGLCTFDSIPLDADAVDLCFRSGSKLFVRWINMILVQCTCRAWQKTTFSRHAVCYSLDTDATCSNVTFLAFKTRGLWFISLLHGCGVLLCWFLPVISTQCSEIWRAWLKSSKV